MKSVKRNGYGKAPAQLSVNQKIFNVLMAFVLVFTLIPVTSLTYAGEANAEETNAESVAQQLSDTEGSLGEGFPQNIDSGQESTGGSEEFQGSTNSPEVQEGGRIILVLIILGRMVSPRNRVMLIKTLIKQISIRKATITLLIPPLQAMKEISLAS